MSGGLLHAVVLGGIWCLVMGELSARQAVLGLAFGALYVAATGLGRGRSVPISQLAARLAYLAAHVLLLLYDVVRSNLGIARRLARRTPDIRPGIVRVSLGEASDLTAGIVAHAITVAPGQMVVDFSEDGRTIYVHMLDATSADARGGSLWRAYRTLATRVYS